MRDEHETLLLFHQECSSGGGEEQLDFEGRGYIGDLDLGCKRDRRIKDDPMITRLGHRKNGVVINQDGESGEELTLEERSRVLLWICSFKMLTKHLGHLNMEIIKKTGAQGRAPGRRYTSGSHDI